MLSKQGQYWDNIAQLQFLCRVVQEAPNNIAQVKILCNVVLEAPDNNAQENVLINVVLILFEQQCIGQNPIQCCPRGYRQHCIRKNPVQCCVKTLGTTLHRSNFMQGPKQLCKRKIMCNVAFIILGQHCTDQNPMQFWPRGSRQRCI